MLRPFTPTRCLVLLACVSCLLIFTLVPRYDLLSGPDSDTIAARALILQDPTDSAASSATSDASSSSSSSSSAATSTTQTSTTSTAAQTSQTSSQQATPGSSTSQPQSTQQTSTTSPPSGPSSPTQTSGPSQTSTPAQTFLSSSATVDQDGETSFVLVTVTRSDQSSSASASNTATVDQDNSDGSSKGVSTSTIIGLSVAGGIALLGIVGFFVWKFTRKRAGDDFDDSMSALSFLCRTMLIAFLQAKRLNGPN